MSSAGNFLQPRGAKSLDAGGLSDTLSEISESGTTNSGWTSGWDSREDLRDFATKLGLADSELYKDRIRVDRKKLELMLSGDRESPMPADDFFEQIMEETSTCISWPKKLKIGAKSKKDPHIKIAGREEDVQTAKERIQTVLDTRAHRVTLKMDVSYTDHSHIIGRGGANVRRIMEETKCHVHFPDSNRCSRNEKSNQVSVSGDLKCVESARSRIRQMAPVIIGFEPPIMSQTFDMNGLYVLKLQEEYGVQVLARNRPKLHSMIILVKGVEWEVDKVKKATTLLMEYVCQQFAGQTPVHMNMEISLFHHAMVIGRNHRNIKDIMQMTGARILFPDADDPNIPSLKKSNVTISGQIDACFTARQILTGCLPLMMMFDLPGGVAGYKSEYIAELQNKLNVIISVRMKAKQNSLFCTIKGPERHATNIYRARNEILNLGEQIVFADIPENYHMIKELLTPTPLNPQPISPMVSSVWHYPAISSGALVHAPMNHQFAGLAKGQKQSHVLFPNASPMTQHQGQFSMSSGYQSAEMPSCSKFEQLDSKVLDTTLSSIHSNQSLSPTERDSKTLVASYLQDLSDRNNNSASKESQQASHQISQALMTTDLEEKRMAASMAMRKRPVPGQSRYPNGDWAGYGLSQSFSFSQVENEQRTPERTNMNNSNLVEQATSQFMHKVTSLECKDLQTLLSSIGLEKYIMLFESHDVDLDCFLTLVDKDLRDVGVNSFGARRKMMIAITEFSRYKNFNKAPGGERKSQSSTSSWLPDNWTLQ